LVSSVPTVQLIGEMKRQDALGTGLTEGVDPMRIDAHELGLVGVDEG
jgi:hypothetical protein